MSDGGDAPLDDRRRPPGARGGRDRANTTPPRLPGATPCERFAAPAPAPAPTGRPAGNDGFHSQGAITVADLIAKLGPPEGTNPSRHHRATPDVEPSVGADEPEDDEDTEIFPAQPVAASAVEAAAAVERHPARPAPEPTLSHPAKPKSSRRPMLLAARSLAALMAVLALALTGGAWEWSTSKNNRLNHVSALDPNSHDIVDPNAQYGDENFLLVGIDSRAGANGEIGAGDTEDAEGARSDTVILVNIPANRKRVVAVSFPRDLAISPIQCEAWSPETGAYGPVYDQKTQSYGPRYVYTESKLNSAFSFGGPKCLVKVIQKLSGLSINHFLALDFVGFATMVDALGGVEVCTTRPLKDYELGTVLPHAGRQVIDGQTALNYVRARQVTTEDNGDYGRIKRQQLFLSSLLRSLISQNTFFSLGKLNNVVNTFISNSYVDNVKTKDLVDLGQSLQGMSAGHVTFVTVPTGVTDTDGNEPPRTSDMRTLFDAIIDDDPLPGENERGAARDSGPTPTTPSTTPPRAGPTTETRSETVQTTAPNDVTVQVSNATGVTGLAATATNQLKQQGFQVMAPDDYPSSLKSTTVFFSPGNEQAAATVASAFANPKVARVTGIGDAVQVVLGPDFRSVTAPVPTGSAVNMQVDRTTTAPTTLPQDLTVTNAADTACA